MSPTAAPASDVRAETEREIAIRREQAEHQVRMGKLARKHRDHDYADWCFRDAVNARWRADCLAAQLQEQPHEH